MASHMQTHQLSIQLNIFMISVWFLTVCNFFNDDWQGKMGNGWQGRHEDAYLGGHGMQHHGEHGMQHHGEHGMKHHGAHGMKHQDRLMAPQVLPHHVYMNPNSGGGHHKAGWGSKGL